MLVMHTHIFIDDKRNYKVVKLSTVVDNNPNTHYSDLFKYDDVMIMNSFSQFCVLHLFMTSLF